MSERSVLDAMRRAKPPQAGSPLNVKATPCRGSDLNPRFVNNRRGRVDGAEAQALSWPEAEPRLPILMPSWQR